MLVSVTREQRLTGLNVMYQRVPQMILGDLRKVRHLRVTSAIYDPNNNLDRYSRISGSLTRRSRARLAFRLPCFV